MDDRRRQLSPLIRIQPQGRRPQTFWLWVLFLVLAVLIGCLVYLAIQTSTRNRPVQPPQTALESSIPPSNATVRHWGDRYCFAGLPKPSPAFHYQITVLTNSGYLVGYCESRKDPVWVCYRLFKVNNFEAPPRPREFMTDTRTRARVSTHDYSRSGYDRGHMAPNYAIAVCYGRQGQLETFLMSNVIPQRPALNRQVWEHLEQTEIKDYAPRFKQIWVIDGPVFRNRNQLRGGEDIPDACFKIIVKEGNGVPQVLAFIMPQTVRGTEMPQQFLTSIDEIEKETGLDFFAAMPDDMQGKFEGKTATGMW